MNVNSWMVLKSNQCYRRNGYWKAWCGNRTVTRKSSMGALHLCSGAWCSEIWTNTTVL